QSLSKYFLTHRTIILYFLKYGKVKRRRRIGCSRPGQPSRRIPLVGGGRPGGNARRRDRQRSQTRTGHPELAFGPPAYGGAGDRAQGRPFDDLRGAVRNNECAARLSHRKLLQRSARYVRAAGVQASALETGQGPSVLGRSIAMKRLHVHVGVEDLPNAIGFYSALFATQPTVVKADYAKWMLDDPRVNFAISTRGKQPGLDHLGIQVESEDELQEVYARLRKAGGNIIEQGKTSCCYAKSEKSWIDDPAGISWETFFTTGESTQYGDGTGEREARGAPGKVCCEPQAASQSVPQMESACCA